MIHTLIRFGRVIGQFSPLNIWRPGTRDTQIRILCAMSKGQAARKSRGVGGSGLAPERRRRKMMHIMNKVTPRAHVSTLQSYLSRRQISGAIKSGVPHIVCIGISTQIELISIHSPGDKSADPSSSRYRSRQPSPTKGFATTPGCSEAS